MQPHRRHGPPGARRDAAPAGRAPRGAEPARTLTPQPGIDEIDQLVEQVRSAGLPVQLRVAGLAPEPLPAGLQLAAYRIVQEALTNTLKHAGPGARGARGTDLRGRRRARSRSRDSAARAHGPPPTEGVGLRGMRERAAVYDGVVEAGPLDGGGWRVRTPADLRRGPAQAAPA